MQGFRDCSRRVWGERLAGQINIWWLRTSPLVLPVKLQFNASLVKGTGSIRSVPKTAPLQFSTIFRKQGQAGDDEDEIAYSNACSVICMAEMELCRILVKCDTSSDSFINLKKLKITLCFMNHKVLDLHSGGTRYESRLNYHLSQAFCFFLFSSGEY